MQIQKHLFRVSQRTFKNTETKKVCSCLFTISISLLIGSLVMFVLLNSPINKVNGERLKRCIRAAHINIKDDEIWSFYFGDGEIKWNPENDSKDLQKNLQKDAQKDTQKSKDNSKEDKSIDPKIDKSRIVYNGSECIVYRNLPLSQNGTRPKMQFSRTRGLLSLTFDQRSKLFIQNYTFVLNYGLIQTFVTNPAIIMITQISKLGQGQLVKKDGNNQLFPHIMYGRNIISFPQDQIPNSNNEHSNQNQNQKEQPSSSSSIPSQASFINHIPITLSSFIKLLKLAFFYMLISVATSMYIYGTIISAPAVVILILSCTKFGRPDNMTEVYRIFPWIGLHIMARETAGNERVRRQALYVCTALLFYFFVMYLIYYAIIYKSNYVLFEGTFQPELQELFFSFMAIIEFLSIVFMRTRPFIKFYPKIHSILLLGFLFYCTFAEDGYKKLLLWVVIFSSVALFCWMIIRVQIPAHNTWERGKYYTPSVDRPRIGMTPIFNMGWINDLPQEWSRWIPLMGRNGFSQGQLALVDREFQRLDAVLQGH